MSMRTHAAAPISQEYNNAQLVTYLAVATKMAATMGTVLEKSQVIAGSSGGRGGHDFEEQSMGLGYEDYM